MLKINNNHIAFLREYEKLCNKYKMSLEGCGCCGSAFLTDWASDGFGYIDELENIHYCDDKKIVLINNKTIDDIQKEVR